MENALLSAAVFLGTAVLAVPLAARLGLGSVLGYLAAGILIGPVLGLVGGEAEELRHWGEYGVVVLLFLVGLEIEPRALWDLRHRLLGLGGLQIALTAGLFGAGALWLGHPPATAAVIGMVFAMSSTAIVWQTMTEKGLTQTEGGRSTFSVLLGQDIAVIPTLALLPLLAAAPAPGAEDEQGASLVAGLPAWAVVGIALAAVAAVALVGAFLTRPVFRWVNRVGGREMNVALSLFIVVSVAVLMQAVGMSPALGTFLAGVVLAGSEFRHEIESDLQPFKGLLLGLFFISIGAGVDMNRLLTNPMGLLALTAALIAGKAAILYGLARLFRLATADRWQFTLGLAQGGEFGFVLVSTAIALQVMEDGLAQTLLLMIALSMFATPLLFILMERLVRQARDAEPAPPPDPIDASHPVIVAGLGRFGQIVARLLRSAGEDAVLLDGDMDTIETMRTFGHRVFLGDPTVPDVLESAGIGEARVLVAALGDPEETTKLVTIARARRPDLLIVARAQDRTHAYALIRAGADDILREVFDSSLRAGRTALEALGVDRDKAEEAARAFAEHDEESMRELAGLWDPDTPLAQNEAYVARARELHEDLETALMERLDVAPAGPEPGPRARPAAARA